MSKSLFERSSAMFRITVSYENNFSRVIEVIFGSVLCLY